MKSPESSGKALWGKTVEESLAEFREAMEILRRVEQASQEMNRDLKRAMELLGEPE